MRGGISIEPKTKPKFEKPKIKEIAATLPKDAYRMLAEGYQKAKQEKQPTTRPEQDAVQSIEDGMKQGVSEARRGGKKLLSRKKSIQNLRTNARKTYVQKAIQDKGRQAASSRLPASVFGNNPKTRNSNFGKIKKSMQKAKTMNRRKKTAQQALQVAQKTGKAAVNIGKKLAMALAKTAAAGKALVAALAACGPVLLIVIAVGTAAAILASSFGLFFSSEESDSSVSVRQVVQKTSADFSLHIETIAAQNPHDELDVQYHNSGYLRADNWIDILAVFAVKTTTSDDGMDVMVLDEAKAQLIEDIFWAMHTVEHSLEEVEHTQAVLDESGNDTGETETITTTILHIAITGKSALQQADEFSFSAAQREQLSEMMKSEYDSYWESLLGISGTIGNGTGVVGSGNFIWPSASSDYVTSPFGSRVHLITKVWHSHSGIDISAGENTEVLASDSGTVPFAGWHDSYGNYVDIDHGNGMKTRYAHNNSLLVSVGASVEQGDVIALVGSTGMSTGPHIHLEVFVEGSRVDPLQFFDNYTTAW